MSDLTTHLVSRVTKYSPWLEAFFLVCLLAGASLTLFGVDAMTLISIALSCLAVLYFLNAFRVPVVDGNEDAHKEPMNFNDMLALAIIPKVLWISSATSTMGILFYMMDLGNEGYKQMLLIGCSSIAVGVTIMLLLSMGKPERLHGNQSVLMRAIPLAAIAAYILFQ